MHECVSDSVFDYMELHVSEKSSCGCECPCVFVYAASTFVM